MLFSGTPQILDVTPDPLNWGPLTPEGHQDILSHNMFTSDNSIFVILVSTEQLLI